MTQELTCVHGKLNSDKYKHLLKEWLPHARERFPDGITRFQQYGYPTLHSESVKDKFMRRHHFEVMEWPPRPPDLNPIENVWLHWSGTFSWIGLIYFYSQLLHCETLCSRVHAAPTSGAHRVRWRLEYILNERTNLIFVSFVWLIAFYSTRK